MTSHEPIELWQPDQLSVAHDTVLLGELLHAVVHAGGDVGFILPFSHDDATAFWQTRVLPAVEAGTCRVLVTRCDEKIIGTVQLDLATPPNQPHRAEVKKLLVHPNSRRGGVARALMIKLEQVARASGRTLLTLDTASNHAEQLYAALGFVRVGTIPRFSLKPDSPELESTTVMYKELTSDTSP